MFEYFDPNARDVARLEKCRLKKKTRAASGELDQSIQTRKTITYFFYKIIPINFIYKISSTINQRLRDLYNGLLSSKSGISGTLNQPLCSNTEETPSLDFFAVFDKCPLSCAVVIQHSQLMFVLNHHRSNNEETASWLA